MFKLIKKLLLFTPLLAGMMFVSYKVDPSGLFWGSGFERIASEYMLQGFYIDGYERLDGRTLNETYAKNVSYAPQILVNGSSRSMMIDSSFVAGDKTFYNAANVGGDIYDFFTSYYIFAKENKEPEIMVLGVDPWIFNDDDSAIDMRSNAELYYEFMGEELGYTDYTYEEPNPYEKYQALIDPSYFQGSVAYYFKDKSADATPQIVEESEVYNHNEVIKTPDGSIIYDVKFRTRPQEQADYDALTMSHTDIYRLHDFYQLSETYTEQFERFISYLQAKNIKVIIYIPAYHPYVYDAMAADYQTYHCLFEVEEYLKNISKEYSLEIYGSYSPYRLNLTNEDFYDGLHLRPESVKKVLPEIV